MSDLAQSLLDQYRPFSRPHALLLAGGSASGKTRLFKSLLSLKAVLNPVTMHGVWIDPDLCKEKLPTFDAVVRRGDPTEYETLHEESSVLSKDVARGAIDRRYDLVLDTTLSNKAKAVRLLTQLSEAGYTVHILAAVCPLVLAHERNQKRFREEGRRVPAEALTRTHQDFWVNHLAYLTFCDQFLMYDTTQEPKLLGYRAVVDGQIVLGINDRMRYTELAEEVKAYG